MPDENDQGRHTLFAIVFCAGFILGPLRILWLVPKVGTKFAEMIETPVMLVVMIFAARWTTSRIAVPFPELHTHHFFIENIFFCTIMSGF